MPDDQSIDAEKDSENAKNLIRGYGYFCDAKDREGVANLIMTCDQQFKSGKLITNSTARGQGRDFQTNIIHSDEEDTRVRVAAALKEYETMVAQSKKKLSESLVIAYAQNYKNRILLDQTYSMGDKTPRSKDHALTSEYDTAKKYASKIGILEMIEKMNTTKLDLSLDEITKEAQTKK